MAYQSVLPFDEEYAWRSLVSNLKKLTQGATVVYYGIEKRKITFRCIDKGVYLVTSYSLAALRRNIEHEGDLKFVEVEFMSTMIKNEKHLHVYEKSPIKKDDWKKQIYRCKDAHCTHHTMAVYVEGKQVKCFKCHKSTFANKEQLRHSVKQLTCIECSKSPKKEVFKVAKNVVNELLEKLNKEQDPILAEINRDFEKLGSNEATENET